MSLRIIEASLFTQLETLLTCANPAGYVAAVVRVAGDREAQAKLEQERMTTNNVVALAFDRRVTVGTTSVLHAAAQQIIYGARWRVSIVVRDLREQGVVLAEEDVGVYALMDAVTTALSGFRAAGLWRGERVRPLNENNDVRHRPGRYVATLMFETRYAQHAPEPSEGTAQPLTIHGDVNLIPLADTAPNPITEIETS